MTVSPLRIVQARGTAEVEQALGLGAGIAGLVHQLATTLYIHANFHQKICGGGSVCDNQPEQRSQRASLHRYPPCNTGSICSRG